MADHFYWDLLGGDVRKSMRAALHRQLGLPESFVRMAPHAEHRTATEVRMRLEAQDAMVRGLCDNFHSHLRDALRYAFQVRRPIEAPVDGSLRRRFRRRKRHARYRRGREGVRPRMRASR